MAWLIVGGPCAGRSYQPGGLVSLGAQLRCGGGLYELRADADWHYLGPAGEGSTGYDLDRERDVYRSWRYLMSTLGKRVPRQVTRAAAARRRLGKIVR